MSAAEPERRFAALGDRTRLSLLMRLARGGTWSITALAAGTALTRQAVTKHLRVLEDAGLVSRDPVGRESRYAYDPAALAEMQHWLDDIARQWDASLARLRAMVEDHPAG